MLALALLRSRSCPGLGNLTRRFMQDKIIVTCSASHAARPAWDSHMMEDSQRSLAYRQLSTSISVYANVYVHMYKCVYICTSRFARGTWPAPPADTMRRGQRCIRRAWPRASKELERPPVVCSFVYMYTHIDSLYYIIHVQSIHI